MPSLTKLQEELARRLDKLEKGHSKLMTVRDELRLISMEYADIRSRIADEDLLMARMNQQMEFERRMRRVNLLLILMVLLLASIIIMQVAKV